VVVPIAELATAGLCIAQPRVGASLALGMLLVFTGFLRSKVTGTKILSSSTTPPDVRCSCFGSLGDDTVTSTTFVRNGLLCLAAVVVLLTGASFSLSSTLLATTTTAGSLAVVGSLALGLFDMRRHPGSTFAAHLAARPEGRPSSSSASTP
jgi:hypothetical protein